MSDYLTTDDLGALDAAAAAATPGPWHAVHNSDATGWPMIRSARDDLVCDVYDDPNVAYIAAADPATVRAMIAELRARRTWDAEAKEVIGSIRQPHPIIADWITGVIDRCPPIPDEAR